MKEAKRMQMEIRQDILQNDFPSLFRKGAPTLRQGQLSFSGGDDLAFATITRKDIMLEMLFRKYHLRRHEAAIKSVDFKASHFSTLQPN